MIYNSYNIIIEGNNRAMTIIKQVLGLGTMYQEYLLLLY